MAEGGVQARPGGAECPHCLHVFRTLAGMRLHERKAHPEFYHEEERRRKDAQPRKRWSVKELTLLSQFELDHSDLRPGELVSLAKRTLFPGRTLDSLRCQRKSQRFRTILEAGSPRPVLSPRPPVPAGSPPVVTGAQTVRAGTPPVVPVRERRPQNLNASRRCASTLEAEGESNLPPLVHGAGRRRARGDDESITKAAPWKHPCRWRGKGRGDCPRTGGRCRGVHGHQSPCLAESGSVVTSSSGKNSVGSGRPGVATPYLIPGNRAGEGPRGEEYPEKG
ncbi:hypothetical protein Pmani_012673 [Petrolisthes manimaculis]|uniref:C2H2-type domain-containing protein n=1 Tax=Petrolisthes manimaculis TaxID=1843537 RepID=A0AAE1PXG6_9EUCA|nr:hypothetical protein Pmani_012673 [Petrolisthes manimaculis]